MIANKLLYYLANFTLQHSFEKIIIKLTEKEINSIKTWAIASFHPAFLMRQPEQKKMAWIDLKMVRDKIKVLKI